MSGLANGSVKTAVKSTRNQAICYFLIGLSLFFAVIFLCVIAFIALSWIVSPILSATIIFAFWLIVALVVFLSAASFRQRDVKSISNRWTMNVSIWSLLLLLPLFRPF
ncbi:phage holin family protein [Bartonella apihabitans]|uniref:phage holin family protein n=1 Tax=Bartonella apihabitans TaxID=2750929 RepID=UPI001CEC86E4|nr:phage holin family protein [Bartonella apihabitans]